MVYQSIYLLPSLNVEENDGKNGSGRRKRRLVPGGGSGTVLECLAGFFLRFCFCKKRWMKCWEKKEGKEVRMSVSLIFKIAAVGILVSVLSQVLKHSGREEQAFLTSLAGLILVLIWIVPYIYDLFETMRRLFAL